ncbi:hypothetical protein FRC07_010432 [Ceratobasidium sp. 392]|nr:hypothetical protein FRC07_010432 [Ceratobasidium sp. 392]
MDDEMRNQVGGRLPDRGDYDDHQRPRAHSVLPPPSRRQTYDTRPDPRASAPRRQSTSVVPGSAPGWTSPRPPPGQPAPYYTQEPFGAHAYIEPRSQPQMPPPPPPGHWGGYQLRPRSPGPYDPRSQYRGPPPQQYSYPATGYPSPPYAATVDPNIFKSDPYGRHPGIPPSPGPDPSRSDVQITYTDDSATKLTQYLRRRCFNCRVTEPPGWRKSTLNPGKIVCNKCGLYERSHARPRPLHMDNPKGPGLDSVRPQEVLTLNQQDTKPVSSAADDIFMEYYGEQDVSDVNGVEDLEARPVTPTRASGAVSDELSANGTLTSAPALAPTVASTTVANKKKGKRNQLVVHPSQATSLPPAPLLAPARSASLSTQDNTPASQSQGSSAEITSLMTAEEIIPHLNARGCPDLTDKLDLASCSEFPVSNGGFGDIYKANLRSGIAVAIKTMRLVGSDTKIQKHLKHAASEIYTWSKCRHQNVHPLLGLAQYRGQIGMVSLWEENGAIKGYLERHPEVDPCQMSYRVAEGLAYLHQAGVIHGDLKAANILVSQDGYPMLADFGNAILQEYTLSFTATNKAAGSTRWMSPELLEGNSSYSIAADVYALGMPNA